MRFGRVVHVLAIGCSFTPAIGAQPGAQALKVEIVAAAPSISGTSLEDWKGASIVDDFRPWQPNNLGEPKFRTRALILWGKDALYVAVQAFDPDPSKIRSFTVKRDSLSGSLTMPALDQDGITLEVDPSGSGASALAMVCTPSGSKEDGRTINTQAYSNGFDFDWDAHAARTDYGYIVKFRMPLTSVQGVKGNWKIRISRSVPREFNYVISWPGQPVLQNCTLCNLAEISAPPQAKAGEPFYLIPFVTYNRTRMTDPVTGERSDSSQAVLGFDARYATGPRSFESTYRPDFSAIEADIDPLAVNTRFKVPLVEKRPFFMNGLDAVCQDGTQAQFDSRAFVQPRWAVKGNGNESWGQWLGLAGEDQYGGGSFSPSMVGTPTQNYLASVQIPTDNKGSSVAVMGTYKGLSGGGYENSTGGVYLKQQLGNFTVYANRQDSQDSGTAMPASTRGFTDLIKLTYADNENTVSVFNARTSPNVDFGMGFINLNGWSFNELDLFHAFVNQDGFWSKLKIGFSVNNRYWWGGAKFQELSVLSATLTVKGGFDLTLMDIPTGKEWIGDKEFKSRNLTGVISYNGIPGTRITASRQYGPAPDYATGQQVIQGINDLTIVSNVNRFLFSLSYTDTLLQNYETRKTNLHANRVYAILGVSFPQDLYARVVGQSVRDFQPATGSSDRRNYIQYLLGWQPSAFTNCYIGYTRNAVTTLGLPYPANDGRLFLKFSKSVRF